MENYKFGCTPGHWCGSILWYLYSEKFGQVCCSFSTCAKLSYNVPRATNAYLVENVLAEGTHQKIQSQVSKSPIQQEDGFRTQYLKKLLNTRLELKASAVDTGHIDETVCVS